MQVPSPLCDKVESRRRSSWLGHAFLSSDCGPMPVEQGFDAVPTTCGDMLRLQGCGLEGWLSRMYWLQFGFAVHPSVSGLCTC